jgi:hypothetical protein
MFNPAVLIDLGRVGQLYRTGQGTQPVHQPIPVAGRFDRNAFEPGLEGRQKPIHWSNLAVRLLMLQPLAILIHNADH